MRKSNLLVLWHQQVQVQMILHRCSTAWCYPEAQQDRGSAVRAPESRQLPICIPYYYYYHHNISK